MDNNIYTTTVINRFLNKHFFFNDKLLKRYYEEDKLMKFRNRLVKKHSDKSFEKIVYVIITDICRKIILQVTENISEKMKKYGDLIITGGEAFNYHMDKKDRLITSDIDAKFIPKLKFDNKYFGKLQGVKLYLWNELGKISKKYNKKIVNEIISNKNKLMKFIGIKFDKKGPYVKRRFSLIKKSKQSKNSSFTEGDVLIDVELFTLDLNIKYFDIKNKKINDFNIGGILDIPFMRPNEFGYQVHKYTSTVKDKKLYVADKMFLMKDILLMHTLNLRPEKKEKDRFRLIKLLKTFNIKVENDSSLEELFKKISKLKSPKTIFKTKNINLKNIMKINPKKYEKFTTKPSTKKLSKQIVHGIKTSSDNITINNFKPTHGSMTFDVNNLQWKNTDDNRYIGNQYNMRPTTHINFDKVDKIETLYGFREDRNKWVPKPLLRKSADIPFIGLKT